MYCNLQHELVGMCTVTCKSFFVHHWPADWQACCGVISNCALLQAYVVTQTEQSMIGVLHVELMCSVFADSGSIT